jgi:hypothetical protein
MPPRVNLSSDDLEAMLDRAAERGAAAVLERLGCPADPAEATLWLADVQHGVSAVRGVRGWIGTLPGRVLNGLVVVVLGLAALGAVVVGLRAGVMPPSVSE